MDTTLRTTTTAGTGGALGTRASPSARLAPVRSADQPATADSTTPAVASSGPSRRSADTRITGGLQDQVARAQQALDYLDRVASQLELMKGELTAKLSGARSGSRQQLDAQVRQLAQTLQARKSTAGGGVNANLTFTSQPATTRFRIRGLDIESLKQSAPQSIAFSVGSTGGPQTAIDITPNQSSEAVARAIDRAMAPMGVRASLDDDGQIVFSTPESNWSEVKDSIAVSGRGKVQTEEVPPAPLPQNWDTTNLDGLRQSLREVVQALERVHHSQSAASDALASANMEVARAATPPPAVNLAAEDFSNAAANTDYDTLLSLSSALVGVSRERVLALLGLR